MKQTWIGGHSIRRTSGFLVGIGVLLVLCLLPASGGGSVQAGAPPTPTPVLPTIPFLFPPFAGGYPITAYVDHWTPDSTWDDTVVYYTGEQAHAIDGIWGRTPTFRGGYWDPESERTLYYDGHIGTDYATPRGVTILAAAPGEVIFAGSVPSGCETPLLYVSLEHENGYRTHYVHLDGICVQEGDWVEAGDPLGISGATGCVTGAHLHLGVQCGPNSTDPYGWQPQDRPDPLRAFSASGAGATWLWAAGAPPSAPLAHPLTGRLTSPRPDTHTNGELLLVFEPDLGCPPLAQVEFWAYYTSEWDGEQRPRWHRVGVNKSGADSAGGWTLSWDTRSVPEGPVWLHAWAVDETGRVGKGSPILDSVTVDRHPPLGSVTGLLPGGAAGEKLWLYVTAEDLESGVKSVTLLARARPRPGLERLDAERSSIDRPRSDRPWTEIGRARRLGDGEWLFEWEPAGPPMMLVDGTAIDVAAQLTDGAGNSALTEPVEDITLGGGAPLGWMTRPASGDLVTTTVELVFEPGVPDAQIDEVSFWAWHDQAWHAVGTDAEGRDGWQVRWDPADLDDQAGVRLAARPRVGEQVYTALPQVTGLILDRTPPSVRYVRPRSGGVARPDVAQQVSVWEEGSGVARVEFYADWGQGWVSVGIDERADDGWSFEWDAAGVPDGPVDVRARAWDRAGNAGWSAIERDVDLDRGPPVGELRVEPCTPAGCEEGATFTLVLDVMDAVSGLDRAIFYARCETCDQKGWRHLGMDAEPDDGLRLEWDSTSLGVTGPVTFTAWVYDRAGNHVELEPVGDVWIEAAAPLAATPIPSPTPTRASPTATPVPVQAATPTATQTWVPTLQAATPTVTATLLPATDVPSTATATPSYGAGGRNGLRTGTLLAAMALAALMVLVGVVGWLATRLRRG